MSISKRNANIMLFIAAIIWGLGYVLSKIATNALFPAGLINALRGAIYAGLMFVFFYKHILKMTKSEFVIGLIAGILNFLSFQFQTIGVIYTTPSNNAFLTAIYVALVPFIMWMITKTPPERKSYFSIVLSLIGIAILTNIFTKGFTIQFGDLLTIISAFFYAGTIVYFGTSAAKINPFVTSFMLGLCQFVFGGIWSLLFETAKYSAINWKEGILSVIALGIFSSFLAQTLQIVGQKFTDPTAAGLILVMESLFGSIFSVVFMFDALTWNLVIGGLIILLAQIIMQIRIKPTYLNK